MYLSILLSITFTYLAWFSHDEGAEDAIGPLHARVRVPPVGPGVVSHHLVPEARELRDGTLRHHGNPIHVRRVPLGKAVPVYASALSVLHVISYRYLNGVSFTHLGINQFFDK